MLHAASAPSEQIQQPLNILRWLHRVRLPRTQTKATGPTLGRPGNLGSGLVRIKTAATSRAVSQPRFTGPKTVLSRSSSRPETLSPTTQHEKPKYWAFSKDHASLFSRLFGTKNKDSCWSFPLCPSPLVHSLRETLLYQMSKVARSLRTSSTLSTTSTAKASYIAM